MYLKRVWIIFESLFKNCKLPASKQRNDTQQKQNKKYKQLSFLMELVCYFQLISVRSVH